MEIIKIQAKEGKIFRRISDQKLFGNVIYLGYTYYEYDTLLDVPFLERPEHFEEIDDPYIDDEVIIP